MSWYIHVFLERFWICRAWGHCKALTTGILLLYTASSAMAQEHVWSFGVGGIEGDAPKAIAVDGAGNLLTIGEFRGTVDFGGGERTSAGGIDVVVAKYTNGGVHIFSNTFGNMFSEAGTGIASDADGNILITGAFDGEVDFGGGPQSGYWTDAFVVKYNPAGAWSWTRTIAGGGAYPSYGYDVVVDGDGAVFVTGGFAGDLWVGESLPSAGGDDIFVSKLDASGSHLWTRSFGDVGNDWGRELAVDASGDVFVAGGFSGVIDLGGGPLSSGGNRGSFIAKLGAAGEHLWSSAFGGVVGDASAPILAVDGAGNLLLTGWFTGSVDFGGGALTSTGDGSTTDIYVVKYDARGNHIWSHAFGDMADQWGAGIMADASNNPIVIGGFQGTINFGESPIVSAGGDDIFLAKFSAEGSHVWSQRFGGISNAWGDAISIDGSDLYVAGGFYETISLGGPSLTSAGQTDMYFARISDPEAPKCGVAQLGLFFDAAGTQTSATISAYVPFNVYVHAFNVADLEGWSASLQLDPSVTILSTTLYPPEAVNRAPIPGFEVEFGTCVNGPDAVLAVLNCGIFMPVVPDLQFSLGPPPFGSSSPEYVTCTGLVSAFAPGSMDPNGSYPDNTAVGNPSSPSPVARPCPPVARNDNEQGTGPEVVIDVVANDYDADGFVVRPSVQIVVPPPSGTAVANGDGTVTVTGDGGVYTFGYTVQDDDGFISNVATVTVSLPCTPPSVLEVGVPAAVELVLTGDHYYRQDRPHWAAIALTPAPSPNVLFDFHIRGGEASPPGCCSGTVPPVRAPGQLQLAVGDYNHAALGGYCVFHYAGPHKGVESEDAYRRLGRYIEWDSMTDALAVDGSSITRPVAAISEWIVDVYDVALQEGTTYEFQFAPEGNVFMALFGSEEGIYWKSRTGAIWTTQSSTTWTASSSDIYGLVIYFDGGGFVEPEPTGGYEVSVLGVATPVSPGRLGRLLVHPNVPNPMNPSTTIRFEAPARGHVTVNVYDIAGKYVATLFDRLAQEGLNEVPWDGRDHHGTLVSGGVYFYHVSGFGSQTSQKMVLVR